MKRKIEKKLLDWKNAPDRKALLIRGARQVGKTYSVRELGKTFSHFIEVNFEENRSIHAFFQDVLEPARLCEKLSAYYATPINAGETLLFFDEIQACPDALRSLRFFHEKMPSLHVVGAGSLLEIALSEIPSMGVGRISSLFMYPMTFEEYLAAAGERALCDVMQRADSLHPVDEPFHRRLVDHVKTFQLIGGMPAVVRAYAERRDLAGCFKILDDLILTLEDDFAKYRKRVPVTRISEVFRSVAFQAGGKFKYSFVNPQAASRAVKDALVLLFRAGLAHQVVHTHGRGVPLGAQADERKFKALPFDIGIHQRFLGLDIPGRLTAGDVDLVNKGSLAEVLVGLEIIGNHRGALKPALHYWHRETRSSNAEVDYVIQQGADIVPVEVKAGTRGQMQSMRIFMDERGLARGVRVSLENFSKYGQVETIPLYAAGRLGLTADSGG